jgi:hypothetical protein
MVTCHIYNVRSSGTGLYVCVNHECTCNPKENILLISDILLLLYLVWNIDISSWTDECSEHCRGAVSSDQLQDWCNLVSSGLQRWVWLLLYRHHLSTPKVITTWNMSLCPFHLDIWNPQPPPRIPFSAVFRALPAAHSFFWVVSKTVDRGPVRDGDLILGV